MFGVRPKLPVRPEQQEWIDQSFALLTQLFGSEWVRNAPLVLPNEEFFPRKWEATEEWAAFAFDRVCQLMRVDRDRVDLEFFEDSMKHLSDSPIPVRNLWDAGGTYREIPVEGGRSRALITLKDSLFPRPEAMVAVMAHELAHVHLLGDKRISRDMDGMEPLTDLFTVFSGFGILNANAAHVQGLRGAQSATGYLSQREYGYSLALFAWARGETNPAWTKELSTNVRAFTRATLACFKASKRPPA
jgi:hypothetical protein